MTINEQIRAALEEFEYPCYHNVYTGEEQTYFVFNYTVIPDSYSDDSPEYNRYLCQVHLYSLITLNTITLSKRIKLALEEAGFTYPEQVDASDDDSQHIVFECVGVEYIERDE